MDDSATFQQNGSEIAIIGLSGRFPGAKNIAEFWENLQAGVESITFFTDEELISSGVEPTIVDNPKYVKARGVLADAELFDAPFFGFTPKEAEITDPQHRLFLECAWSALENAGYNCENYPGSIGVHAGSSLSSYLFNIYINENIRNSVDAHQIAIGGDKDFLSTRVSYKFNLQGPSYTVQTACSTSLVAVHLACQSLLNGECDMALAGGVSISALRKQGYFYKEGGIGSPDGHCRAFDANAQGTVGGEGVGIVVLKRLEDAIADQDTIYAVIKGSATNNDGSQKVSYTAPRIESQAKVIRTAQVVAEVPPETITYIEAHGTGTSLGDPIEIAALTEAFRASTEKSGFCAIGSLKTNTGHLDAAAGIAGLIKTVLALQHQKIPPSLHYQAPNPQIDFANSPFYVNTQLIPIHEKSDANKASRIKSQPVIEATIDVFNFSKRFQIKYLNSSNVPKLSHAKCLLTSSHNRSMGLTCGVCGG
ncbi:beta-ketoacyl synthase [Nostoc cycadae WK-1]|uniref:Beta-ketoacyl synthase n=1 Tax=Nostoc cycadae WK-1 TaxID=1861711 RepID=A0A2H6LJ41_9NOSO|nr:beta-ketoacyl synthase [Nostoc cycadae WK-1]